MNSISILDNMLGEERSERLIATVVEDLCSCLEQKKPADDEEMGKLLDTVMEHNPGINAANALHDHALFELTARVVQDLDWKRRNDGSISQEMKQAVYELAQWLAGWLQERSDAEDLEEEEEYESPDEGDGF